MNEMYEIYSFNLSFYQNTTIIFEAVPFSTGYNKSFWVDTVELGVYQTHHSGQSDPSLHMSGSNEMT